MTLLRNVPIDPDDLLSAAKTVSLTEISTCGWLGHWVSSATFSDWAKRGLAEGDAHGLSNAIAYAKRAAACRIDVLVRYNHLAWAAHANYPAKLAALRLVGLEIPDVVQELVIEPRNDLEHEYQPADGAIARHAVGISDLFLKATKDDYESGSIVALGWNVMGSHAFKDGRELVQFREFGSRPMLFIDVFSDPPAAKIVDPGQNETRAAELRAFTQAQSVSLARLLRTGLVSLGSCSVSGRGPTYYSEMKRQGGF